MKRVIPLLVLLITQFSNAYSQTLDQIQWMTEEFPPLNYTEDSVRKGLFVDVLKAMWAKLGVEKLPEDIEVLPWARSYMLLQNVPGTALFATSRTAQREDLFKWVGPINVQPISIIAKKEKNYDFTSIEAVNQQLADARLGGVREDSGSQYFLENAGDPDLLVTVSGGDLLVKMLEADRVDAIAYLYNVAIHLMKTNNIDTSKYELVYKLKPDAQGWYAFHKDTDQSIIDQLQSAFDELVEDGTISRIDQKYK